MADQMTRHDASTDHARGNAADAADGTVVTLDERSFEALYSELGALARALHEAADNLAPDETQLSQTQRLILDARERLDHFLQKSAQAADGALVAVEQMIPLSHQVVQQAEAMREALDAGAEGAAITEQMRQFIDAVEHNGRKLRTGLSDVLVAQEFQELTGEVVERAVDLADEAERRLLGLLEAGAAPGRTAGTPAPAGPFGANDGRSARIAAALKRLGF